MVNGPDDCVPLSDIWVWRPEPLLEILFRLAFFAIISEFSWTKTKIPEEITIKMTITMKIFVPRGMAVDGGEIPGAVPVDDAGSSGDGPGAFSLVK